MFYRKSVQVYYWKLQKLAFKKSQKFRKKISTSCFTSNFSHSGEEFCFTHHEFESNTTFSRRVTKSCKSQLACHNEPLGCTTDPLTGLTVSTLDEITRFIIGCPRLFLKSRLSARRPRVDRGQLRASKKPGWLRFEAMITLKSTSFVPL